MIALTPILLIEDPPRFGYAIPACTIEHYLVIHLQRFASRPMKKQFLAALTSASLLLAGAIAGPATATIFGLGDDPDPQLSDLYDDFGGTSGSSEVSADGVQTTVLNMLSFEFMATGSYISSLDILKDPEMISVFDDGGAALEASGGTSVPSGLGVISKSGCTADVACAIGAAGIKTTLICVAKVPASGGSLADGEDIADCLKDVDYDGYIAASNCTYGSCPGFASIGQDDLYACNTEAGSDVMALFN